MCKIVQFPFLILDLEQLIWQELSRKNILQTFGSQTYTSIPDSRNCSEVVHCRPTGPRSTCQSVSGSSATCDQHGSALSPLAFDCGPASNTLFLCQNRDVLSMFENFITPAFCFGKFMLWNATPGWHLSPPFLFTFLHSSSWKLLCGPRLSPIDGPLPFCPTQN